MIEVGRRRSLLDKHGESRQVRCRVVGEVHEMHFHWIALRGSAVSVSSRPGYGTRDVKAYLPIDCVLSGSVLMNLQEEVLLHLHRATPATHRVSLEPPFGVVGSVPHGAVARGVVHPVLDAVSGVPQLPPRVGAVVELELAHVSVLSTRRHARTTPHTPHTPHTLC